MNIGSKKIILLLVLAVVVGWLLLSFIIGLNKQRLTINSWSAGTISLIGFDSQDSQLASFEASVSTGGLVDVDLEKNKSYSIIFNSDEGGAQRLFYEGASGVAVVDFVKPAAFSSSQISTSRSISNLSASGSGLYFLSDGHAKKYLFSRNSFIDIPKQLSAKLVTSYHPTFETVCAVSDTVYLVIDGNIFTTNDSVINKPSLDLPSGEGRLLGSRAVCVDGAMVVDGLLVDSSSRAAGLPFLTEGSVFSDVSGTPEGLVFVYGGDIHDESDNSSKVLLHNGSSYQDIDFSYDVFVATPTSSGVAAATAGGLIYYDENTSSYMVVASAVFSSQVTDLVSRGDDLVVETTSGVWLYSHTTGVFDRVSAGSFDGSGMATVDSGHVFVISNSVTSSGLIKNLIKLEPLE